MPVATKCVSIYKRMKTAGFSFGLGKHRISFGAPSKKIIQELNDLRDTYSTPVRSGIGHALSSPFESLGLLLAGKASKAGRQINKDLKRTSHIQNITGSHLAEHGGEALNNAKELQKQIEAYQRSRKYTSGGLATAGFGGAGLLFYLTQHPEIMAKLKYELSNKQDMPNQVYGYY